MHAYIYAYMYTISTLTTNNLLRSENEAKCIPTFITRTLNLVTPDRL
jgi:hypothetical protein